MAIRLEKAGKFHQGDTGALLYLSRPQELALGQFVLEYESAFLLPIHGSYPQLQTIDLDALHMMRFPRQSHGIEEIQAF